MESNKPSDKCGYFISKNYDKKYIDFQKSNVRAAKSAIIKPEASKFCLFIKILIDI